MHNAKQKARRLSWFSRKFPASLVEVLVEKKQGVLWEAYPVKQFVLGGVAANKGLRTAMAQMMERTLPSSHIFPSRQVSLCGDNAAMIGAASL